MRNPPGLIAFVKGAGGAHLDSTTILICWEDKFGSWFGVNEATQGPRVKSEKVEQAERKNWLREIELEVEAQGREWMRRRLQERLQAEADRHGLVFPPERTKAQASAD